MTGSVRSSEKRTAEVPTPSVFVMVLPNRQIIPLALEQTESGVWLATHPAILVHGTGDTPQEAAVEFVEMARDQYEDYLSDREALAPHLLEELHALIQLFEARTPAA
jgi:hypothetical protein